MRLGAAQLLSVVVLHAERGGTQAMAMIINAIIRGCGNNEPLVTEELERCCEIIGCLIPYDTWGALIEPLIENNCLTAHLRTTAHLLKGSSLPFDKRQNIAMMLSSKEICQSRKPEYLLQLLKCTQNLLPILGPDEKLSDESEDVIYMEQNLYTIVITALALSAGNEKLKDKASETLKMLAGDKSLADLHSHHLRKVLKSLMAKSADTFSKASVDCLILETVFLNCSCVINEHWDLLCVILLGVFEMDAEIKIKMLATLAKVFLGWLPCEDEDVVLGKLVNDIICPNLVWAAGQSAEATRCAAIFTLCALVQSAPTAIRLLPVHSALLLSLLDDHSVKTRLYTVKVLAYLPNTISRDQLGDLYLALGKRLDDVNVEVRHGAAQVLGALALIGDHHTPDKNKPDDDESYFVSRAVLIDIYKTSLLHLDDKDEVFSGLMLESLKNLGTNGPRLLMDIVQSTKQNFRNQSGCDELQERMKALMYN